uniref:RNase H domain-containing protein n=1 Tax=Rhodnius prolixus TaxID=13249 RepID=T1HZR9_RHOPR
METLDDEVKSNWKYALQLPEQALMINPIKSLFGSKVVLLPVSITTCDGTVDPSCTEGPGLAWHNKVRLEWVPGHVGIKGNETADQRARNGAKTPFVDLEPVLGITKGAVCAALRDWMWREHEKNCETLPGVKHVFKKKKKLLPRAYEKTGISCTVAGGVPEDGRTCARTKYSIAFKQNIELLMFSRKDTKREENRRRS